VSGSRKSTALRNFLGSRLRLGRETPISRHSYLKVRNLVSPSRGLLVGLLFVWASVATAARMRIDCKHLPEDVTPRTAREALTCECEKYAFYLWSGAADDPQVSDDDLAKARASRIHFQTGDGRSLTGLQLHATGQSRGGILVIQGNAWAALTVAPHLQFLQEAGFDVFVYDFRGYAMSKAGNPSLKALFEDYREILTSLAHSYQHLHVYSFSGGGIIAVDALASMSKWSSIVVDSTPAKLPPGLGCPDGVSFDPIDHLPASTKNMLFITGGKDGVVKPKESRPLLNAAKNRGADHWEPTDWQHPFQGSWSIWHPFRDREDSPNNERQRRLVEYFAGK
jgi:pimeloyl-ACP methyl ester carboxylesterase